MSGGERKDGEVLRDARPCGGRLLGSPAAKNPAERIPPEMRWDASYRPVPLERWDAVSITGKGREICPHRAPRCS